MEQLLLDSMLILLWKDWIRSTALDTSYQEVRLDMLTASITEYDFSLLSSLCIFVFHIMWLLSFYTVNIMHV